LRRGFKEWNFQDEAFPAHLKKRQISTNPQELPGFYYRDYGLRLWDVISHFVK